MYERRRRLPTTMTSSPTTSTSGRRKCLSATIAAKHAQSSIFPESARKWIVSRKFHTYARFSPVRDTAWTSTCPTRCPDCMHNDSLSTTSLRRMILSNMRVIITSSSEGLWLQKASDWIDPFSTKDTYRPCSYSLEAMADISE